MTCKTKVYVSLDEALNDLGLESKQVSFTDKDIFLGKGISIEAQEHYADKQRTDVKTALQLATDSVINDVVKSGAKFLVLKDYNYTHIVGTKERWIHQGKHVKDQSFDFLRSWTTKDGNARNTCYQPLDSNGDMHFLDLNAVFIGYHMTN